MIFANGKLLPDSERKKVLSGLEKAINATRMGPPLESETVIAAVDALGRRLAGGEFDALLARYLPAGATLAELLPMLRRETLEQKLRKPTAAPPPGCCLWAPSSMWRQAICPACPFTAPWRGFSPAM